MSLISDAVLCFGESATEDDECQLLAACTLWWESMLEPAILHPKEMCGAVNVLSDNLKGGEQLLRSKIRSGLAKEVIVFTCMCAYVLMRLPSVSVQYIYMCACTLCGIYITLQFLTKFERKMKGLSLNTFVAYYCSLSIIPNEVCVNN